MVASTDHARICTLRNAALTMAVKRPSNRWQTPLLALAAILSMWHVAAASGDEATIWTPAFTYAKKATWDETYAASLAASSITVPVLGDWFYIGPFDNTGGRGFDTVYPPEEEIALDQAYEGKGGVLVRWKHGDRFVDGRVNDLKALFDDNEDSVVYLHRTIYAPSDMECVVSLGSDDTLTVWLNRLKLLAKNVERSAAPDQDRVRLPLRRGENDLLLKICQRSGDWAFYFDLERRVPPSIEVPLLSRLISDFPADPKVDSAYERLYEIRCALWRDRHLPALDLLGVNVKAFGASGVGAATNGTIDAGSRVITNVGNASTFRPGHGIYLWHFKPLDGLAVVDVGRADYVASVKVCPRPGDNPSEPGLAFRVEDGENYWALSAVFANARASKARIRLIRVRDGEPVELRAKDFERPSSPSAALMLKVVLKGQRIQAFVNNRALFDLSDRFNSDARKAGLFHGASHRAGSPIYVEFRVASLIHDDFDRPDNRYDLGTATTGQRWQALAGRWGITDRTARRTEGATGEKLATVVTGVGDRQIRIAHPWPGEDNALVEIYHDDTRAIERALATAIRTTQHQPRHLIFPEGVYNISRPLRLGAGVGLTGLSAAQGTGASIRALPGFAPEYDDEKFLLHWLFANAVDAGENRNQSLESITLAAVHPETNPGLSGVRLATGSGGRFVNVEIDVPRRGIVLARGSSDSLFESLRIRAGETCIDIGGRQVRSLSFLNLSLTPHDTGKPAVGMRIGPDARGIVVQNATCRGLARPVLIQGATDVTLLGLNATGPSDYPVVEVERAGGEPSLMVSGTASGFRRAVSLAGETVAWVGSPSEDIATARSFRFVGGQSGLWLRGSGDNNQASYIQRLDPREPIAGGQSLVLDLIDTRMIGGGCAIYEYVARTGSADATVEIGTLTLVHNFDDFQVVRSVGGRVGPEAAKGLFTPEVDFRDGLLSLRIRADVPGDRRIWFNAIKRVIGIPGGLPSIERPTTAGVQLVRAPSRPGADGYIRDWLVIGPVPYKGDSTSGVLTRDDLNGEPTARPRPGDATVIRGERLLWLPVHCDAPFLDLSRVFRPGDWRDVENAFAYMVAYLETDAELPNLTVRLDFDDAVRLWLNGQEVRFDRDGLAAGGSGDPRHRVFDPAVGEKPLAFHGVQSGITLAKGQNVLVLKVCNERGLWAVGLRFKDVEGRPVRDFRVSTSPLSR